MGFFQHSFCMMTYILAYQERRKSKNLPETFFCLDNDLWRRKPKLRLIVSPFNFSKDKTLAILASSKLSSFLSFTCFELLGVDVQLSGLSVFMLFCFFAVCCLHFSSSFVNDVMSSASQCSDPLNQHNICINHDQLLIFVPHKYLLKLSSCPLQFSLLSQCEQGQFLQHNREKVGYA